jgi:hypothetical protein
MTRMNLFLASLLMGALAWTGCQSTGSPNAGSVQGQRLAHTVFFTLTDNSPEQKAHLVSECQEFLRNHPGVISFAVGTLASDLQRTVNVRDFDVSLHIVFASRSAHDAYQKADQHLKFIERNQANWKQVRVFDSDLKPILTPIPAR